MSLHFYHVNSHSGSPRRLNILERYEEREISKLETTEGIKIIACFLASVASRKRGERKGEKNREQKSYAEKTIAVGQGTA